METMELSLDSMLADVRKKGFNADRVIKQFKALREKYKEEKKPFLVKTCRLAYEHIERNDDFVADVFEERTKDDMATFEYFLTLMKDVDNPYNKEELDEYNELFRAEEEEFE